MHTPQHCSQPPDPPGMPHPAAVILSWLCLAIGLQVLAPMPLLVTGALLAVAALAVSASRLYALARRTRWIMVSLLLIYACATPGEALWAGAGAFSPTREGLADGLLQLGRVASALAGLTIVLALLPQQQLIAGLYALALPLRFLGLSRERLAVRLALTLHYAEGALRDAASGWRTGIEGMLAPPQIGQTRVQLCVRRFRARDALLVATSGGLLAAALW